MHYPLQLALGIVGNGTSLALFLSPLPTFWSIYKLRSTQEYSDLPYVCTLFNCALWLLYGTPFVKPNSILILTINGVGFLLELFYLACYLAFASKKKKLKTMRVTFIMTLAFVGVVLITLLVIHTIASRQLVAGTVCVVLSIAMYVSPLSIIGLVIRTKSVEYMPFLLSLFNLLNALVWAAYSVVTRDIFVAIPNAIGCVCGVIQLTVYCMYRNSKATSTTKMEDIPQTKPNEAVHSASIQKVQEDSVIPTKVSSPRFLSLQRVSPRIDPNAEDKV